MKKIYLFCTEPWLYITELPVIIMLSVAIRYNELSPDKLKYYPLIIFLILFASFIFIYFFRVISVSNSEIAYIGPFSSKDSAEITKDRTLVISIAPHTRTKIELFGDAGEEAAFDWMKAEDVIHRDICLFSGKVIGKKMSAKSILRYFSINEDDINKALITSFDFENDILKLTSINTKELHEIKIHFKAKITPKEVVNEH